MSNTLRISTDGKILMTPAGKLMMGGEGLDCCCPVEPFPPCGSICGSQTSPAYIDVTIADVDIDPSCIDRPGGNQSRKWIQGDPNGTYRLIQSPGSACEWYYIGPAADGNPIEVIGDDLGGYLHCPTPTTAGSRTVVYIQLLAQNQQGDGTLRWTIFSAIIDSSNGTAYPVTVSTSAAMVTSSDAFIPFYGTTVLSNEQTADIFTGGTATFSVSGECNEEPP